MTAFVLGALHKPNQNQKEQQRDVITILKYSQYT